MASKKQIEGLSRARDKASAAVYAAALPREDLKFSDCLKLASPTVKERYEQAVHKLLNAEYEAVSAGKAWRGAFNMLVWYR